MDAVIEAVLAAVIYVVSYFLDIFRRWRFLICILAAVVSAIICWRLALSLGAALVSIVGMVSGIAWEYRGREKCPHFLPDQEIVIK